MVATSERLGFPPEERAPLGSFCTHSQPTHDHWSTRYQLTVPAAFCPPECAGDEAGKQGSERLREPG